MIWSWVIMFNPTGHYRCPWADPFDPRSVNLLELALQTQPLRNLLPWFDGLLEADERCLIWLVYLDSGGIRWNLTSELDGASSRGIHRSKHWHTVFLLAVKCWRLLELHGAQPMWSGSTPPIPSDSLKYVSMISTCSSWCSWSKQGLQG